MHQLLGTWRFSQSILMDDQYAVMSNDPMNEANGILMYTDTGYMSVHLQVPDTQNENFSIQLLTPYIAYFGKFYVDDDQYIVTHEILGSSVPDMVGKTVQRSFEFESADAMSIINPVPEKVATREAIFRKVFWRRLY